MNVSSIESDLSGTRGSTGPTVPSILRWLARQILAVGLGVLGGAAGVAGAIGLAILVQLILPAAIVLSPGVTSLTITAALLGVGFSWFISRVACRLLPGLSYPRTRRGLQVIMVFSVLTSLLQSILFTQG